MEPTSQPEALRGHRIVDHPADQIVEAWGPTRGACLEEAVLGLVASFADVSGARPSDRRTVDLVGTDAESLLVELLAEVVYLVDGEGVVVTGVTVVDVGERLHADLDVTPARSLELTGPAPRSISWSGLVLTATTDGWRAAAVIEA